MSTEQPDDSKTQNSFDSLTQALTNQGIPIENWHLIQRVVTRVGISSYESTTGYLKATRDDGGPDLHIYYGYTGGFISEDEILEAVGDVDRWLYEKRNLWSVGHPLNRSRGGGTSQLGEDSKPRPVCPDCFLTVPATGKCDGCGWVESFEN